MAHTEIGRKEGEWDIGKSARLPSRKRCRRRLCGQRKGGEQKKDCKSSSIEMYCIKFHSITTQVRFPVFQGANKHLTYIFIFSKAGLFHDLEG